MMNQENLEFREVVEARAWEEHELNSKKTLILDIILLVFSLYLLFFVGHYIKWPALFILVLIYFVRRLL